MEAGASIQKKKRPNFALRKRRSRRRRRRPPSAGKRTGKSRVDSGTANASKMSSRSRSNAKRIDAPIASYHKLLSSLNKASDTPVHLDFRLYLCALNVYPHGFPDRLSQKKMRPIFTVGSKVFKLLGHLFTFMRCGGSPSNGELGESVEEFHERVTASLEGRKADHTLPPSCSKKEAIRLLGAIYWSNLCSESGRDGYLHLDKAMRASLTLLDHVILAPSGRSARKSLPRLLPLLTNGSVALSDWEHPGDGQMPNEEVERMWGYEFTDKRILERARIATTTMSEIAQGNLTNTTEIMDNEAMEFLGDGVLSLLSVHLTRDNTSDTRHSLAHLNFTETEQQVTNAVLADKMQRRLERANRTLAEVVRVDRDDLTAKKRWSDLYEAFIGAIFLDSDMSLERVLDVIAVDFPLAHHRKKAAPPVPLSPSPASILSIGLPQSIATPRFHDTGVPWRHHVDQETKLGLDERGSVVVAISSDDGEMRRFTLPHVGYDLIDLDLILRRNKRGGRGRKRYHYISTVRLILDPSKVPPIHQEDSLKLRMQKLSRALLYLTASSDKHQHQHHRRFTIRPVTVSEIRGFGAVKALQEDHGRYLPEDVWMRRDGVEGNEADAYYSATAGVRTRAADRKRQRVLSLAERAFR